MIELASASNVQRVCSFYFCSIILISIDLKKSLFVQAVHNIQQQILCSSIMSNMLNVVFFSRPCGGRYLGTYLGTEASGLPYVTVITGTHIPGHSANQKQPFVIPAKNSSRHHAQKERCATHRPTSSSVAIEGGLSIPPTDRPSIHAWAPLHPDPNPPTPSADRDLPNWPPDCCLPTLDLPRQSQAAQTARRLCHRLPLATRPHRLDTRSKARSEAHDAVQNNNSTAPRPGGCLFLHPPSHHHIPLRHASGGSSSSTTDRKTGLRDAPGPAAKGLPPAADQEVGRGGRGHLQQAGQVLPHDRDGTGHVRPAGAVLPATVSDISSRLSHCTWHHCYALLE